MIGDALVSFHGPTWLFCPGDRRDRFTQAQDAADVTVIDLEDAVAPGRKSLAREELLATAHDLDPERTIVRINALRTAWGAEDLRAVQQTPFRAIMIPKVDSPQDFKHVDVPVIALCETAAGVLAADQIARSPSCVAVCWGGQDLAQDLASPPLQPDGQLHPTGAWAQLMVRFAAAAAGVPAIDTVWTDISDREGLTAEAAAAAAAGFDGKLAIHPDQVPVIRQAFAPSKAALNRAHRILEEAERMSAQAQGVSRFEGEMIDAPLIARAQRVIELARAADTSQRRST